MYTQTKDQPAFMITGNIMHNYTASNEEAHIQFLHISQSDEVQLQSLINNLWFFYSLKYINTSDEEDDFFASISQKAPDLLFDFLVADLRTTSPLKQGRKEKLIELLKRHKRPLISISSENVFKSYDENKNWLHISAPINLLIKNAPEIKDTIANYWFNLPY